MSVIPAQNGVYSIAASALHFCVWYDQTMSQQSDVYPAISPVLWYLQVLEDSHPDDEGNEDSISLLQINS